MRARIPFHGECTTLSSVVIIFYLLGLVVSYFPLLSSSSISCNSVTAWLISETTSAKRKWFRYLPSILMPFPSHSSVMKTPSYAIFEEMVSPCLTTFSLVFFLVSISFAILTAQLMMFQLLNFMICLSAGFYIFTFTALFKSSKITHTAFFAFLY